MGYTDGPRESRSPTLSARPPPGIPGRARLRPTLGSDQAHTGDPAESRPTAGDSRDTGADSATVTAGVTDRTPGPMIERKSGTNSVSLTLGPDVTPE
eukprot:161025-Hanusia_phi.AAC.2